MSRMLQQEKDVSKIAGLNSAFDAGVNHHAWDSIIAGPPAKPTRLPSSISAIFGTGSAHTSPQ
jgi:hypothetical protein